MRSARSADRHATPHSRFRPIRPTTSSAIQRDAEPPCQDSCRAYSLEQLVDLYSSTLGAWTRPLVLVAVLTTMFSTALTVVDGFPRAIARSWAVIRAGVDRSAGDTDTGPAYWASGAVLGVLTVLVVAFVASSLTAMVDFATTVSFLTAPILGFLNVRVIHSRAMPEAHRPGRLLTALSYAGLAALTATAMAYLVF